MSNFAVINKIEYKKRDEYVAIGFQSGTASYECRHERTTQGYIYKHTLTFNIIGLSSQTDNMINSIYHSGSIRFVDVNGRGFILGSDFVRLEISATEHLDGTPGSFRGYKVSVEWKAASRALIESFV